MRWPDQVENQVISVIPKSGDEPVIREFFELFKTPWQFHSDATASGQVLLCSSSTPPDTSARLILVYGGSEMDFDRAEAIGIFAHTKGANLESSLCSIPVYGECVTFKSSSTTEPLELRNARQSATRKIVRDDQTIIRIGYDLFAEVRHLIAVGQPAANAGVAALEQHISFLRELILSHSIPLIEIPPLPATHPFIACLTHDVDHVGICNHKWNHTMVGFLYRALVGTPLDVIRGRRSVQHLGQNWLAVLSLPLVYLGIAKDFWFTFDRYLKLEQGLTSTFFLIPKKGEPGLNAAGGSAPKRAAHYDISDLKPELDRVRSAGHEIGVHGLDAWRDTSSGTDELERISRITGMTELGVRMHWLYFGEQSPAILEAAGFSYDSTVGYNETIGFRAGTTQVFKPLATKSLLELPMHVMDTALFYPSYLDLSPDAAHKIVDQVLAQTNRFGGVITINWHDRSISPERLWDGFYIDLLQQLREANAWFATAAQTVSWFRKRRQATFEETVSVNGASSIRVNAPADNSTPGLRIRIHDPTSRSFRDVPYNADLEIPLAA